MWSVVHAGRMLASLQLTTRWIQNWWWLWWRKPPEHIWFCTDVQHRHGKQFILSVVVALLHTQWCQVRISHAPHCISIDRRVSIHTLHQMALRAHARRLSFNLHHCQELILREGERCIPAQVSGFLKPLWSSCHFLCLLCMHLVASQFSLTIVSLISISQFERSCTNPTSFWLCWFFLSTVHGTDTSSESGIMSVSWSVDFIDDT